MKTRSNNITISIYLVRAAIKHLHALNFDPAPLLLTCRISPQLLEKDNARIPAAQYARLVYLTMREMDDELLGYSSRPLKFGSWSAACYYLIHSHTLGQALHNLCRFTTLFERGLKIEALADKDLFYLRASPWDKNLNVDSYGYDLTLFSAYRIACWLVEENITLHHVHLPYPKPKYADEYRLMYQGCPVYFNQPISELAFNKSVYDKPVIRNENNLASYLRNFMLHSMIDNYGSSTWSSKVRDLFSKNFMALPTLETIAEHFSIHSKTLRRRLAEEGTQISEIKDQVRRDRAIYYLAKPDLSVENIASKVGYSEGSAFIRAFKKWTGVTPMTYRKGLK